MANKVIQLKDGTDNLYPTTKSVISSYTPSITAPSASGFSATNISFAYQLTNSFIAISGRFYISATGTGNSQIIISLPSGVSTTFSHVGAVGFLATDSGNNVTKASIRCDGGSSVYIQMGAGNANANQALGTGYVLLWAMIPLK